MLAEYERCCERKDLPGLRDNDVVERGVPAPEAREPDPNNHLGDCALLVASSVRVVNKRSRLEFVLEEEIWGPTDI